MKSLSHHIEEKLLINKNFKNITIVETWDELRKLVRQRYKELGPGTKQNPIYFNDIDVSKLKTLVSDNNKGVFEETGFKYIDVSSWNVSNIKNMQCMFYVCENLESVGNLSNWDVSSVENMSFMFYGCQNLKSIDGLYNWDVSNVKYMSYMFCGCQNLKSIDGLSNWDVSYVKDTYGMFKHSKITNIPNWYKG
jgi:surface protein